MARKLVRVLFVLIFATSVLADDNCSRQSAVNETLSSVPDDMPTSCDTITLSPHHLGYLGDRNVSAYNNTLHLILDHGNLRYIHPGAFNGCVFDNLSLEENLLTEIPDLQVLSGSLQELSMNRNSIGAVGTELAGMVALRLLDLSGNAIVNVSAHALCNTALTELRLTRNNLPVVPDLACVGSTLETLYLDSNNITSLTDAFHNLSSLQYLNLENNVITTLQNDQFSFTPNLTELWLAFNQMSSLSPSAFCGTRITILDLEGLYLSSYPNVSCISNTLSTLNVINQNGGGISNFDNAIALPNVHTFEIYVSNIHVDGLSALVRYVRTFSLKCNPALATELSVAFLHNASDLLRLSIAHCALPTMPDFTIIPDTNAIIQITVADNLITTIDRDVFGTLLNLRNLYIHNNNIHQISNTAFVSLSNHLQLIILNRNPALDLDPQLFSNFTSLRKFEAYDTNITQLPNFTQSFATLENLLFGEEILFGASPVYVPDPEVFVSMTSLRILIMTPVFDEGQTMPNLTSAILDGPLVTIDLQNSEIACNCETQWMKLFTDGYHGAFYQNVIALDDVTCNSPATFIGSSLVDIATNSLCPDVRYSAVARSAVQCAARCAQTTHYECHSYTYDAHARLCTIRYTQWRAHAFLMSHLSSMKCEPAGGIATSSRQYTCGAA